MKNCPKCGGRIRIYNVSQYCPHCKTNLMFYGFEERFYADAKLAEMSLANVRVKMQKLKVGLVGGKLQILRLIAFLFPIAALLAPFGSLTVTLPVFTRTYAVSGLGLYTAFTDGTFGLLGQLSGALIVGDDAKTLQAAYFALIATAAFAVLILLFSILSFISFKKMAVMLCTFSVLGTAGGAVTAVITNRLASSGTLLTFESSIWGIIAVTVGFGIVFALNLIIAIKGLPIEYKPGDLERVAVRKKYLNKEISLDDIEYPIFQTEEERLARLEAIKKTENEYIMAEGGTSGE